MEERKCFACGGFGHIAYNCRKVGEEEPTQVSSNRFEVLKIRVMQREEGGGKEVAKDRKEILREEKVKREVEVGQTKIERKEKKKKLLREVMVKIGLKQEEEEEGVVTEALLDSGAMRLVMSEEFTKRLSQIRYSLVVILELNSVSGVQYKNMMIDR